MTESKKIRHLIHTAWTFLGINILWVACEKLLYKEIQHRVVDDIISLPILVAIYFMWKFKAELWKYMSLHIITGDMEIVFCI